MKPADLQKLKGKTIAVRNQPGPSDKFGKGGLESADRREQRKRDQEAGLVPFAVKLHGDLVKELQAKVTAGKGLNEVVDEIIRKGLKAK
ncbi:hypothetical protein DSM104443_03067 [Usitatibacter rugosus]|uniref:Uncharacterized protein n=1 Tax=Usitatibacter rugosus TaxID=2732067 RepID=A0A6M4GZQ1_9PROT|nr:hypothetical protein [Usitatibacter rugosus]QJR11984.1 hypothetical protein DSM104443_03067 [Usitatibacter rugosus]